MDIKERLQQHIDAMFDAAGAPASRAAYELREELLANSLDRYEDLTAKGTAPEAALEIVVGNIGNVDELIAALPQDGDHIELLQRQDERRQKSALLTAIAVGLYMLGAVVMVVGQFFVYWMYPFAGALIIFAVATGLLVYSGIAYPKYSKRDDSIVELMKATNTNIDRMKGIRRSVYIIICCLTLILYFVMSFATFAWYITWVIFLVGVCALAVASLLFTLKGTKK